MWDMVFPRVKPKVSRVPFVCKGSVWKVEVSEAETVVVAPIEGASCCEVEESEDEDWDWDWDWEEEEDSTGFLER